MNFTRMANGTVTVDAWPEKDQITREALLGDLKHAAVRKTESGRWYLDIEVSNGRATYEVVGADETHLVYQLERRYHEGPRP